MLLLLDEHFELCLHCFNIEFAALGTSPGSHLNLLEYGKETLSKVSRYLGVFWYVNDSITNKTMVYQ